MIVSLILCMLFNFVWMPLGGYLANNVFGTYGCTTQYLDQALVFMIGWFLAGLAILYLIVKKCEVWFD